MVTITVAPYAARRWRRVRLGLLAIVSLLVGHELVYGFRYGLGAALAREMTARGHDGYWPLFALLAAASLTLLLVAAAIRHRRLQLMLRSKRGRPATAGAATRPAFGVEWRALLGRLLPLLLLLFLLQENIEELAATGRLAGLEPFMASDALLTLPLLAIVAGVASLLGALVRWHEARLEARLLGVLAVRPLRPASLSPAAHWRSIADACRQQAILGRRDLGRAPPLARSV